MNKNIPKCAPKKNRWLLLVMGILSFYPIFEPTTLLASTDKPETGDVVTLEGQNYIVGELIPGEENIVYLKPKDTSTWGNPMWQPFSGYVIYYTLYQEYDESSPYDEYRGERFSLCLAPEPCFDVNSNGTCNNEEPEYVGDVVSVDGQSYKITSETTDDGWSGYYWYTSKPESYYSQGYYWWYTLAIDNPPCVKDGYSLQKAFASLFVACDEDAIPECNKKNNFGSCSN